MSWAAQHPTLIVALAFFLLAFVLFEPVRKLVFWLFKELKPHGVVFGYIQTVLHHVWTAHMTVLRNFAPRNRVFMQLGRKRTSHTQDQ